MYQVSTETNVSVYFVLSHRVRNNIFFDFMNLFVGVKITQLDVLDSKGFNRSRIASRAIEAYLIQVYSNYASRWLVNTINFYLLFYLYNHLTNFEFIKWNSDFENRFLSCGPSSWKSRCWCGWSYHLLWLWNDGRHQILYSSEIARSFLCSLWERCKKGSISCPDTLLFICQLRTDYY